MRLWTTHGGKPQVGCPTAQIAVSPSGYQSRNRANLAGNGTKRVTRGSARNPGMEWVA